MGVENERGERREQRAENREGREKKGRREERGGPTQRMKACLLRSITFI
jgi:hypothetical protein